MVVGGDRIARRLAIMSRSQVVRDVLLTEQSAVAVVMIVGMIGLAVAFYLITRFQWLAVAGLFFSMTFSNASWLPVYYLSFATKYIVLAYLGAYTALFFVKNGWRLIATDGYRLVCAYVGWIAFVALLNGFAFADLWYLATEFCLMIGLGIAWYSQLDSTEKQRKFFYLLAYTAMAVTVLQAASVVLVDMYSVSGRFVGMNVRATGFATIFAVFVVTMFWVSMYEKPSMKQRIFTGFAFLGFFLILWSGTRNATVAALIAIAAIWWVIRSRLLVYILVVGIVGLLAQIILADSQDASMLTDRLASTDNTRLGAWELYWNLTLKSPLFGYGYNGLVGAVYGESLSNTLGNYARLTVPGVHQLYLGMAVRWGIVGLILQLALFWFPARVAWRVIFRSKVSEADKRVYILPVSLVMIIMLMGLFEDTIGSTGRGTVHGLVYAMGIPLVYLWGKRLLKEAEAGEEDTSGPNRYRLRRST